MQSLVDYLQDVTSDRCIEFCAARSGLPVERVRRRFVDYAGEVMVGASLLSSLTLQGRRVLEVGAGLGLLGAWLRRQGIAVVMLEPGAGGFSDNERLLGAVLDWTQVPAVDVIRSAAQDLNRDRHGTFDVVFSVNVLEHIPALEEALTAMVSVLSPGGMMRHTCPNYYVPYEPHYGVPLLPVVPAATARLIPRLANDELWQSLNFITYGRVIRFCRQERLRYVFDRGMLAEAFTRIDHDAAFRARRGSTLTRAYRLLRASGLLRVLGALPPAWATPMAFTCWRDDERPRVRPMSANG